MTSKYCALGSASESASGGGKYQVEGGGEGQIEGQVQYHHWTSTWRSVNGWGGEGGFSATYGHQSEGAGGAGAGQT